MNTPRGYFVLRNQLWRLPALLLLAVVFAAGDHALEVGNLNIYVGELDPTGNALISYVYSNDGGRYSTLRTQVRDAHTFKVLHTIALQRPLGGDVFLHWSPNGQRLVGLGAEPGGQRQLVEFDVSSRRPKVVRREVLQANYVQTVFYNAAGRVIHVEDHTNHADGQRPFLRIVEENEKELSRVEYGRDEWARARPERDGAILSVSVGPNPGAALKGDFVFSDGVQKSLLKLDATTGIQGHLVKGLNYATVQNSSKHIAIITANGDANVVEVGKESHVLLSIKSKSAFLLVDADRLVAWNQDVPGPITVHSLSSNDSRDFETNSTDHIAASGDRNLLIATKDGRLTRLDLSTGQRRELLNFRPWFNLFLWTAILGMPLFCVVWLTMASRHRVSWPIVEAGLAYLAMTLVLMAWSRQPSPHPLAEQVITFLILVLLGALMPLMLVWTSTFDSIWGQQLPIGLVGVAVLFSLFTAWDSSNSWSEMAFAGALSIFWQTFGLALFRSRYGGLINRNAQRTLPVKQTQVTMKEIVLAIAAFAVLFSCLRFASWSKVEFGAALVYWLLTYTLSYSFVVLVAIWAALYIRNFFLAIVGFLAISVSSLAAHHYYGKTWPGLAFSPEPEIWYFQVFFAGVLVFAAMRYCRGHRHDLVR